MAIINEGVDATHNAGMGSYRVLVDDTFNGTLGGPDTTDGVNLEGLTIGETYTVSLTVADIASYTEIYLMDQFNYSAAAFSIENGVVSGDAQNFGTASTSAAVIDGNTISFEFTAIGRTSFSLRVAGQGSAQTYSINATEYVAPPAITEGADFYIGTDGNDNVALLGGDDTFDGGAGNDTVDGGTGNDTLTGGADNDVFYIGTAEGADEITDFTIGEDKIDLTSQDIHGINAIEDLAMTDTPEGVVIDFLGQDQLTLAGVTAAELGNEDFILLDRVFVGAAGNDKANGKSGVDIMTGNAGDDQLDGKAGNDQLYGDDGKDKLTGGAGDDTLMGGNDNDLLEGGLGNDSMNGGSKNDRLHGGDGADMLIGEHGNDKLYGDAGEDILNGGVGKDELTGGTGADVFVFENGAHRDTITDFEDGADMLDFTNYVGVQDIADLSIVQSGAHTLIVANGPDLVTLLNTDMALIDATDFIF